MPDRDEMWFVEVKNLFGVWTPQLVYADRPPSDRSAEGARRPFRRAPVKIHPIDWGASLDTLQRKYGGEQPWMGGDDAE